jgi:hypothetical protein
MNERLGGGRRTDSDAATFPSFNSRLRSPIRNRPRSPGPLELDYSRSSPPLDGHDFTHERMARGGHGLPKVSPGPAMPNPSKPCGRATPETALRKICGGLTDDIEL